MSNLTDKQKKFCEEYLVDLNATQAAIRSGYSQKTAASIANENLIKPDIQKYVQELQAELSKKVGISKERVLQELIKVGLSDISSYYLEGLQLKEITSLDNNLTAAISSIKVTKTDFEGGSREQIEFKLHDKLSALDKIAKHLGLYEVDNKQKLLDFGVVINKIVTKDVSGND